jgi:hypothetical protein
MRIFLRSVFIAVLLLVASALALGQSTPAPAPDTAPAAPPQGSKAPGIQKIQHPNMADESALQQTTFSQAVADTMLRRLIQGMQGHNLPQTQSMFLESRFDSGFEDRMVAAFNYYDSFHLYYKTIQLSGEGEQKGTIVADFDLESRPLQIDLVPHRQHARLHLEIERIPSEHGNVWRIVAMDPERFFFEY